MGTSPKTGFSSARCVKHNKVCFTIIGREEPLAEALMRINYRFKDLVEFYLMENQYSFVGKINLG